MNHADILANLDGFAADFVFPMLDNGYAYLAATRLHAYRSETQWAIVIEALGFAHRLDGTERFDPGTCAFGSAIEHPGLNSVYADDADGNYRPRIGPEPVRDDANPNLCFDEDDEFIHPSTDVIVVRGKKLAIPHDRDFYASHGIDLEDEYRITAFELLRGLVIEHKDTFLFSEDQLRNIVPASLDKVLTLEEWNHPHLAADQKPSDVEAFRMIAEVLVTGDASLYAPTEAPNTHWKNWPEGGAC